MDQNFRVMDYFRWKEISICKENIMIEKEKGERESD